MVFKILDKYKNSGTVFISSEDKLHKQTAYIPEAPGVYLFFEENGAKNGRLRYIGASGSIDQLGKFKGQLMRKRINNKMNSKNTRAQFFKQQFEHSDCDLIRIDWYVTYDEDNLDLPKYVEALLFQKYYSLFGQLPEWNNNF